jgi:DNA polymerase-3 subunit epsilon
MWNASTVREIVLDTETTGLDPNTGDRIVEIGCVELLNSVATGNNFHVYLDPERDVPQEAFRVHGLSKAFLTGKPKFSQIAEEFYAFIGQSSLIIHNAEFDVKFLNSELAKCGHAPLMMDRVVDTLAIARRKHPGASNSLDALCTRYKVDNSKRTKHGALLDAEILADIYVELTGARQTVFALTEVQLKAINTPAAKAPISRHHAIDLAIETTDLIAHAELVREMSDKAFWCNFQLPQHQERSEGSA